jgi:protein-S-isoprenylcysteine O-methyltransferase Ste14
MIVRVIAAFLALPGVVAFALPLGFAVVENGAQIVYRAGLLLVAAGTVALMTCVHSFRVHGRGTLAPWDPPRALVQTGLYRYTRNPMYVAVALLLAGWAVTFASPALGVYAAIVALGLHLRVVLGEEPRLERLHGDAWRAYAKRVPRWLF